MEEKIKISSNRSFGILFSIVFLIVATYPLLNDGNIRFWSIFLSIIFFILGILNSKILNPLNKLWFKFGIFLGNFFSPVVMSIIFFLIVTPIALLMRLLKKDLLNLKFNSNNSYWKLKKDPKSKMKNQF
jgi:hypothetical protein